MFKKYGVVSCYLAIAAVWVLWCVLFLAKGIDLADEGLYCTEVWRFAQGDLPFRDSGAFTGLSFWYLSWIFYLYPQCPLLGLRIVWAVATLLCALLTARAMFKYFNPPVTTVGAIIGLLFTTYWGLKVLSYNNIYILTLLLALWLWLTALSQSGKIRFAMAGASGIMAFVATSSRITLLPIVLLPAVTLMYDYLCAVKPDKKWTISVLYLSGYIVGAFVAFLLMLNWGVLGDLMSSLSYSSAIAEHGISAMAKNFLLSLAFYFLPSLVLIILLLALRYRQVIKRSKIYMGLIFLGLVVLVGILVFIAVSWSSQRTLFNVSIDTIKRILGNPQLLYFGLIPLLLAFAIAVIVADLLAHMRRSDTGSQVVSHDRYRMGIVAVFLCAMVILGTNNIPAATIAEIAYIPLAMAACILWGWLAGESEPRSRKGPRRRLVLATFALIAVVCVAVGLGPAFRPYGDNDFARLTQTPATPKTNCMYTTPERAVLLEKVIATIQANSKAGDRILAYDAISMLYYLSDRLPATNRSYISWADSPSNRQSILDDMLYRNRLPAVVIRAANSTGSFPQADDPFDQYLIRHYRQIDDSSGFIVMVPAVQGK